MLCEDFKVFLIKNTKETNWKAFQKVLSLYNCTIARNSNSPSLSIYIDAKIFTKKKETPQFYQPSSSFVVTEVDSIHSQQTCTKNYNQTVATFSQTYWPVTAAAAAIHIILLASNKQVGSVQGILDVWGMYIIILTLNWNLELCFEERPNFWETHCE